MDTMDVIEMFETLAKTINASDCSVDTSSEDLFEVRLVSDAFDGLTMKKRIDKVWELLDEEDIDGLRGAGLVTFALFTQKEYDDFLFNRFQLE